MAVQTPDSGISNLLAVGTTFTGSGNLYCQWELFPGSENALCILFPTHTTLLVYFLNRILNRRWVKLHDVPLQLFLEDRFSLTATQIGNPIMLDSFTSSMCNNSWGRSIFAHCFEVKVDEVLKDSITMRISLPEGKCFIKKTIRVEHEWKPTRCKQFKILGHAYDQCPKNAMAIPIIYMNNDGFQTVVNKRKVPIKLNVRFELKAHGNLTKNEAPNVYTSTKDGRSKVSTSLSNIPTSNPYDWLSEKFDLENYTRSGGCPNVLDDMDSKDVRNLDLRSREFGEAQSTEEPESESEANVYGSRWECFQRVISFEEFPSPHTGHALFKMLIKVLTNFNLEDKVMSITLDNASNNTSAMDELKLKYDPPMGAALNLYFNVNGVDFLIESISSDLEFFDDGFASKSKSYFKESLEGFWKENETMFPVLSRMAMDLISVQASSVASEFAFSTSGRVLSIRRTRLTPASLEMCMCLKDHLDAKERKQDKCPLEIPLDFEEDVFDDEAQRNEAIPLSVEEIALDASSECTLSPEGPRYDYMMSSEAEDDY
nr:hypothetical protein [Tanacetum cinerariifolium]